MLIQLFKLKQAAVESKNLCEAISDLRSLVKRTVSRVDKLSLNDEQNSELCTWVQSIQ